MAARRCPRRCAKGSLELLAPTRCAGCEYPGVLLCPACDARLERIRPERACPRCGAPECVRRCHECRDREFAFAAARCAGRLRRPGPADGRPPQGRLRAAAVRRDGGPHGRGGRGDWAGWADAVVGVPGVARGRRRGAATTTGPIWRHALARSPRRCPPRGRCAALTARDQRGLGRGGRAANVGFTCDARATASGLLSGGASRRRPRCCRPRRCCSSTTCSRRGRPPTPRPAPLLAAGGAGGPGRGVRARAAGVSGATAQSHQRAGAPCYTRTRFHPGLWLRGASAPLVHGRRGRKDPRKRRLSGLVSMARLRGKSYRPLRVASRGPGREGR